MVREMSFDTLQVGSQTREFILVESASGGSSECGCVGENPELCLMDLESVDLLMMECMRANDVLGTDELLSRPAKSRVGSEGRYSVTHEVIVRSGTLRWNRLRKIACTSVIE
jgi:hypothetical protein